MSRRWPWILVIACGLALAAPAGADEVADGDPADLVVQSEAESLAADLTLIAEARGWNLDDAHANREAAEAVGRLAQVVAEERPGMFVGSALSPEPDGPPMLFIKGPQDAFIDELVRSSSVPIVVVDNQPFSFAELEARQQRAHAALLQFTDDVGIGFDIARGGVLEVVVTRSVRLPDQTAVLDALPADLRASVEVRVIDAPVVESEAAYGGMTLLRTGIPDCTSGWTVQVVGASTRGISGAAHCSGMDQVRMATN